jgi:hypothetical protein
VSRYGDKEETHHATMPLSGSPDLVGSMITPSVFVLEAESVVVASYRSRYLPANVNADAQMVCSTHSPRISM